jgi:hypothetical protein
MNNIMGNFHLALYVSLVHKIVLQFYVFPINLPPMLLVLFSHELLSVCVTQPCHGRGLLEVPAFCLGACHFALVWGSALPDGCPLKQLVLMRGPKYTACLAWSCTRYTVDRVPLRTRLKSSPTVSDPAPGMGGLRHHHVSHGTGPPLGEGGLRCHHVSHGSRPASRCRRARASPCVPWH